MARRRPEKKKSNSGLMIGMSISGSFLVLICIILFIKMRPGPADDSTDASSEENLVARSLPNDLPALAELPSSSGTDGTALIALIHRHKRVLTSGGVNKDEESAQIVNALLQSARGSFNEGLLDAVLPENQLTANALNKAIEATTVATQLIIDDYVDDLKFDEARQVAYAELLFGRAMFENNVRLRVRRSGISLMNHALGQMQAIDREAFELGVIEQSDLASAGEGISTWRSAINSVNNAWKNKLESIDMIDSDSGKPNIGDLIRIANEDEDRSFRVFATLRLGYAFHERGDSPNRDAILVALEELSGDDDEMVADAADAAIEITSDVQMYRDLR